jgi:WD40 repeat protein
MPVNVGNLSIRDESFRSQTSISSNQFYENIKCLKTLEGHRGAVLCIKQIDSDLIISGGRDPKIRLWNLNEGKKERSFYGHKDGTWCFQKGADNKTLISGGADFKIKVNK